MTLARRTLLALAAAAAFAAGPVAAAPGVPAPDDMSLGSPKAKIQVVEYASAACPHCAHFATNVFPAFKAKYVDTGKVRYTLKEFITSPPEVAAAGFLMARCAGPSKYFKVLDEVFASQTRWQPGRVKAIFVEIAQANGLSEEQFNACILDEKAAAALDARNTRALTEDGVNSTPTFFVNGKALSNDEEMTLERLDAAIAEAAAAPKPAAKKKGKR